ncbi:MAG: hypothetical protein LBH44_02150, partial [Treponema sp.]|nr:hypothetical protein [Treponema sp.]
MVEVVHLTDKRQAVKPFIFILATFCILTCAGGGKTFNQSEIKVENTTKIVGRVVVFGNEPRTFIGIVDV